MTSGESEPFPQIYADRFVSLHSIQGVGGDDLTALAAMASDFVQGDFFAQTPSPPLDHSFHSQYGMPDAALQRMVFAQQNPRTLDICIATNPVDRRMVALGERYPRFMLVGQIGTHGDVEPLPPQRGRQRVYVALDTPDRNAVIAGTITGLATRASHPESVHMLEYYPHIDDEAFRHDGFVPTHIGKLVVKNHPNATAGITPRVSVWYSRHTLTDEARDLSPLTRPLGVPPTGVPQYVPNHLPVTRI